MAPPGVPAREETCGCCRPLFIHGSGCAWVGAGGSPKRFAVPLSPGTPWGHGDFSAGGKLGLASGWHQVLQLSLGWRSPLLPPPPPKGYACAKKKVKPTQKCTGGSWGGPQPARPKVSAEQFVPSLCAHPPIPPHPGARRNKKIASPYPIPTPKTPRAGGKGGRIAPSQGDARTHLSFSAPPREVHP